MDVMSRERVRYYDNNDMSISFYLERLKTVVDSIDPATHTLSDINDALELCNIVRFIDNDLFHREWQQSYIDGLKSKSPAIKGLIGKYFGIEVSGGEIPEYNKREILGQVT